MINLDQSPLFRPRATITVSVINFRLARLPALMICSSILNEELEKFQHIFIENGFLVNNERVNKCKIRRFKESVFLGPGRCSIYLKLLWLGSRGQLLADGLLA